MDLGSGVRRFYVKGSKYWRAWFVWGNIVVIRLGIRVIICGSKIEYEIEEICN